MVILDGHTWMEHLSQPECWALLAAIPVGRIGVLVDSAPEIYPVNFTVEGEAIVFRTDPGEKLRGLDRSPSVCFEIDGIEAASRTGWSVLVKGRAQTVTAAEEVKRLHDLPLDYWGIGTKARWIRIIPSELTGRRILRPRESAA